MKRCPKCSRNFPDDNQKFCTIDGGLLVAAEKPFDPNATIQGTTVDLPPAQPKPPSNPQPDFGQTIATPSTAPTVVLPKQTGPTGTPTSANLHQQQQQQPKPPPAPVASQPAATVALPPRPTPPPVAAPPPVAVPPPKKKSKLPLILGILALLLILGAGAAVAAFFLVIKPRLDANAERPVVVRETKPENTNSENTNTAANTNNEPTPAEAEFVAPPDTVKFTNSPTSLDGKLAEHYFDFSFYYPKDWKPDPKAGVAGASNFAKVERRLPPDFTQENFAVGWYTSKGSFEEDKATFPQLVEVLGSSLANSIPEYHKLSEGQTKINSLDGYEFRFEGLSKTPEKGDIHIWGRVVFLPSGIAGEQNGATLVMLTTSLAPEISGADDIGTNGQMPVILESFRFGKPKA